MSLEQKKHFFILQVPVSEPLSSETKFDTTTKT